MNQSEIINLITSFFPYGFIKVAILIIVAIYLVFAAIIVRQEDLMSRVVIIPFSPYLRVITSLHLIAVIVIFFLAFFLL